MNKITVHCTVNHKPVSVEIEPNKRLLDMLRVNLGLTSVKEGCSEGECGACTVIYNGEPVTSCCILAGQAEGRTSSPWRAYPWTASPTWYSRPLSSRGPSSADSASPA